MFGKLTGDMHSAERVLKARMVRRGINPARALKLINPPQSLHPGRINQGFFRYFIYRLILRHGKEDILMNRIGDKRHSVINILMVKIGFFHAGLFIIYRAKNQF